MTQKKHLATCPSKGQSQSRLQLEIWAKSETKAQFGAILIICTLRICNRGECPGNGVV